MSMIKGVAAPKYRISMPRATKALDSAARSYSVTVADRVKRLKTAYTLGNLSGWDSLEIPDIPPTTRAQPFNFTTLCTFLAQWQAIAETRFKMQEEERRKEVQAVSTRFVAAEVTGVTKVGRFFLRPRQRKAIDSAIAAHKNGVTHAIMCPLEGGEGKSVIAWGIIQYFQANNWFGHPSGRVPLPNQAMFATAAAVKIDMMSRGRACGIANLGKMVNVISHTEWAAKAMAPFFVEETVERFGQKVKRLRYIMPPPIVLIIDECDAYKKPTSLKSRYLTAIIQSIVANGGFIVCMSATPGSCIADHWYFMLGTGRKYLNEVITVDNMTQVMRGIASRAGASPTDNSARAMEEFRKEFNDCYVIPPRDPRTVKALNRVKLLEFKTDAHRKFYAETMERYYEELDRCGQGDMTVNPMTAFLKLRQSEEWIKAEYFVDEALASWRAGKAPVIGVSFEATLNEIVRRLVFDHGIPRSKISVLQGGSELITREKLEQIIGPELFSKIGSLVLERFKPDSKLTDRERIAVDKYLKWTRERVKFEESEAEQAQRQAQLRTLGLGKQTLVQRHAEKERFQDGVTEFAVFTLSAGGRGIDLDQQFEHVRPREGFFTICYWVEEFLQALYRLMRVATLSNVTQNILFFAGTQVANHVAPRLDRRIKAVRAGVTGGTELADEAIELLANHREATAVKQEDLRSGDDTVDDLDHGDVDSELEAIQKDLSHDDE